LYSVLKYYRFPPKNDYKLAKKSRSIMKWSLVLHMIFGFGMISFADMFPSDVRFLLDYL